MQSMRNAAVMLRSGLSGRECCETVLADAGKILIFLIKY